METNKVGEIIKLFNSNPECFPLGYQYLKSTNIKIVKARTSKSRKHNSSMYFVANFYKPTSNLFGNE